MSTSRLVTIKQATVLRSLGFNEDTTRYAYRISSEHPFKLMYQKHIVRVAPHWRNQLVLPIPTVDEAIDWIRRKFDVVIYNTAAPWVDPVENRIKYGFRVKYCCVRHGWNYREMLERSAWSADCYAAKRTAIWIAIRYILKTKKDDRRRKHRSNRKVSIRCKKS